MWEQAHGAEVVVNGDAVVTTAARVGACVVESSFVVAAAEVATVFVLVTVGTGVVGVAVVVAMAESALVVAALVVGAFVVATVVVGIGVHLQPSSRVPPNTFSRSSVSPSLPGTFCLRMQRFRP